MSAVGDKDLLIKVLGERLIYWIRNVRVLFSTRERTVPKSLFCFI
jgi:hypothetical protein